MKKLPKEFYNRTSLEVAPELIGKLLVSVVHGEELVGRIVEVEAYMGPEDKAAHSYGGRRTERNEVMYGPPGFAYVYVIYGMYNCMNVITSERDVPHGVLIRAVEPLEGLQRMSENRFGLRYEELKKAQVTNLTSGPGKLCKAMGITRQENGEYLCGERFYLLEPQDKEDFHIVKSPRINIDYAEEAIDFPWRFYIKGNKFVSKPHI